MMKVCVLIVTIFGCADSAANETDFSQMMRGDFHVYAQSWHTTFRIAKYLLRRLDQEECADRKVSTRLCIPTLQMLVAHAELHSRFTIERLSIANYASMMIDIEIAYRLSYCRGAVNLT